MGGGVLVGVGVGALATWTSWLSSSCPPAPGRVLSSVDVLPCGAGWMAVSGWGTGSGTASGTGCPEGPGSGDWSWDEVSGVSPSLLASSPLSSYS